MLVKNLLASKPRELITAQPTTTVDEAMDRLITNGIGCLPVLDDQGELIGIVSDKDIFKEIHRTKGEYHSLTVGDIMSTELIVGVPEDEMSYVAGVMHKNWIRHIPIVEEQKLIGLVSLRDIIKEQAQHTAIENRYLRLYMEMPHRRDKSGDA